MNQPDAPQSTARNIWLTLLIAASMVLILLPTWAPPPWRTAFIWCYVAECAYLIWQLKRAGALTATPQQFYLLAKAGKLQSDRLTSLAAPLGFIAIVMTTAVAYVP